MELFKILLRVCLYCDHQVHRDFLITLYKDLTIETYRKWNVISKAVPDITGANGIIPKSLRQYLSNLLGEHEVKELQQTATLATAHTLREVLV
jgi:hypothetical protein